MRPEDPYNSYSTRAQRGSDRKRRAENDADLIRRVKSGGLDPGIVVMAIIVLVALLVFFLSITPSGTR
jgi:hypothetical protein